MGEKDIALDLHRLTLLDEVPELGSGDGHLERLWLWTIRPMVVISGALKRGVNVNPHFYCDTLGELSG